MNLEKCCEMEKMRNFISFITVYHLLSFDKWLENDVINTEFVLLDQTGSTDRTEGKYSFGCRSLFYNRL